MQLDLTNQEEALNIVLFPSNSSTSIVSISWQRWVLIHNLQILAEFSL